MEAETKELRNSDKERFQEVKGIILNLEEQLEDKCRIL